MPEEHPTVDDQVLTQLSRLDEKLEARFERIDQRMDALRQDVQALRLDTHGRLSSLEGGFEQMDKRMGMLIDQMDKQANDSNARIGMLADHTDKRLSDLSVRMSSAESLQRWAIGLIITSWLTLVGLSLTVLFKVP